MWSLNDAAYFILIRIDFCAASVGSREFHRTTSIHAHVDGHDPNFGVVQAAGGVMSLAI